MTRTFSSQPALWDNQSQYESLELVVQSMLINYNYRKQLMNTFMQLLLGGHHEK